MRKDVVYYMVHNPLKSAPNKRYFNHEEAERDAKELAKLHVGTRFYVLQAIECFVVNLPEPTRIEMEKAMEDPFIEEEE